MTLPSLFSVRLLAVVAVVAAPLTVVLALGYCHDPVAHESSRALIHRHDDYVGSAACASCHPDQHASWARTFHRTMTQRAEQAFVVGAFDGRSVELFGQRARPHRDGARFLIDVPTASGGVRTAEVALAVGSRRYQQYFEKVERPGGECFQRLPLLWHIEAQRWMHLNGVFLEPDDDNWSKHASIWNENCIFCHNTGARPGIVELTTGADPSRRAYDSHVGELGIACEACHGPGGAHARTQQDPLARYAAHRQGAAADIVHPGKLDHERSTALCGQCHGQRLPSPHDRIAAWMQTGSTFRPGNRLVEHVEPLTRDTPSLTKDHPTLFADRFWGDGTARLTAYELQGVTQSPCYERGQLACSSCHVMHGGDPRGMIEDELRGDRACTQCHTAIGNDVAAHTKHAVGSTGSQCLDCHMPRAVFGILSIHRSHRIEVPDPRRDGEAGRPHACTLCHADQTLAWSAEAMDRWWGGGKGRYQAPAQRPDGVALDVPDALASLLAGDAVQRAVYADALGQAGVAAATKNGAALRVALIATLFDAYPSIRYLAAQSLRRMEAEAPAAMRAAIASFDHTAPAAVREAHSHTLFQTFAAHAAPRFAAASSPIVRADYMPAMDVIVALLNKQSGRVIAIGE